MQLHILTFISYFLILLHNTPVYLNFYSLSGQTVKAGGIMVGCSYSHIVLVNHFSGSQVSIFRGICKQNGRTVEPWFWPLAKYY